MGAFNKIIPPFPTWFCDSCFFLATRSQDVFKSVERLCETEGIDYAKFMYRDNTTILETLEGSRCDMYMVHICRGDEARPRPARLRAG